MPSSAIYLYDSLIEFTFNATDFQSILKISSFVHHGRPLQRVLKRNQESEKCPPSGNVQKMYVTVQAFVEY